MSAPNLEWMNKYSYEVTIRMQSPSLLAKFLSNIVLLSNLDPSKIDAFPDSQSFLTHSSKP